jgi:hypothetical protein
MNSDIAFAQRAENRVGNCVRERVCIGMTFGATVGSDPHAAEYKLTPLDQPVRISPNSDPYHLLQKSV